MRFPARLVIPLVEKNNVPTISLCSPSVNGGPSLLPVAHWSISGISPESTVEEDFWIEFPLQFFYGARQVGILILWEEFVKGRGFSRQWPSSTWRFVCRSEEHTSELQ